MTNFRRTMIVQAEEECNAEKGIPSWNAGQSLGKANGTPFFLTNGRRDPLSAEADLTAVG